MERGTYGFMKRTYKGYSITHFKGALLYRIYDKNGHILAVKALLKDAKAYIDEETKRGGNENV